MEDWMLNFDSTTHGHVEFYFDGAESIAFWVMFDDQEDESWYCFTFEEADKIRDFLNRWLPQGELT